MAELIYPEESYKVVGACLNVYREKGCGFLEPVYQECLQIEFGFQKIPFEAQKEIGLTYRGISSKQIYRPDFLCFGKIVLELKAASAIADEHRAQVLNYLNATGLKLGILANFGHHPGLEHERLVL